MSRGFVYGVGEELRKLLGDPAEGVSVWRLRAVGEVPGESFEIEVLNNLDAAVDVGGLDVSLETLVGADGPRTGGELSGVIGGEFELVLGVRDGAEVQGGELDVGVRDDGGGGEEEGGDGGGGGAERDDDCCCVCEEGCGSEGTCVCDIEDGDGSRPGGLVIDTEWASEIFSKCSDGSVRYEYSSVIPSTCHGRRTRRNAPDLYGDYATYSVIAIFVDPELATPTSTERSDGSI